MKIVFFGDSNVSGRHGPITIDESFVSVFAQRVAQHRWYWYVERHDRTDNMDTAPTGEGETVVVQRGIPFISKRYFRKTIVRDGGGARNIIEQNEHFSTVERAAPDVLVFVGQGTNDALTDGNGVGVMTFAALTLQMFRRVACRRLYVPPRYESPEWFPKCLPYIDVAELAARAAGVEVVNVPSRPEYWQGEDIYHPNAVGHEAIALATFRAVFQC